MACANMMIHKDGKTNLVQMDAKSNEASNWIKNKKITKVLMNPPYERKYGCMKIVKNVLDNVPENTRCAFILPEKKLEKDNGKKLLKDHTLTTIIKMPENLFFGIGITTSIFIFETGRPQNGRNIIGYYMAEDGLETVKNKGRHDVKDKWNDIENYWITAIRDGNDFKYNTRQIINPKEHLSYQMPKKPFEIYDEDFIKTIMDYEMFKRGIDVKEFNDILLQKVLYGSDVTSTDDKVTIIVKDGGKDEQN
ncbi:N-6 DNA methylase [Clostridioides difficile]